MSFDFQFAFTKVQGAVSVNFGIGLGIGVTLQNFTSKFSSCVMGSYPVLLFQEQSVLVYRFCSDEQRLTGLLHSVKILSTKNFCRMQSVILASRSPVPDCYKLFLQELATISFFLQELTTISFFPQEMTTISFLLQEMTTISFFLQEMNFINYCQIRSLNF